MARLLVPRFAFFACLLLAGGLLAMAVQRTLLRSGASVADRIRQYGAAADARWQPSFAAANRTYPPARIGLLVFKDEARMEVQAAGPDGHFAFVRSLPILAASGGPGPKLREGDRQVPEGIYRIESLNPNSSYHLALRLNYPNDDDRAKGREDGREHLGGDIMIHGRAASIGCLAMGDPAAEDLFVLAARTGIREIEVLLCPGDLRRKKILPPLAAPAWTKSRYAALAAALLRYPLPGAGQKAKSRPASKP